MTTALQGWAAESAQDSRLKAGTGYRDATGGDVQLMSALVSFPWHWDPPVRSDFARFTIPFQSGRGLAGKPWHIGDRGQWADFVAESKRLTGPINFVLKLLESWRLDRDNAVLLLGFDESDKDLVRAVFDGREALHGRDVRDRIAHLFQIRKSLATLFRDLDVENDWLREPHELLDDQKPLELLLGGSMEDLLLVREYVDAVSGR